MAGRLVDLVPLGSYVMKTYKHCWILFTGLDSVTPGINTVITHTSTKILPLLIPEDAIAFTSRECPKGYNMAFTEWYNGSGLFNPHGLYLSQ